MTLRWVGPGLGVALLFSCGGMAISEAPETGRTRAPEPEAAPPNVFEGPLAVVEASRLGCPGDVAVVGAPIDVTESLGSVTPGDATLVALNDGTYRALTLRNSDIVSVHLDHALARLSQETVRSIPPPSPTAWLSLHNVLTSKGYAFAVGATSFADFFAQDVLTQDGGGFSVGPTLEGNAVFPGTLVGDGETATAWVPTSGGIYRRALDEPAWQVTDLKALPHAQWQENGNVHVLSGPNDVVLGTDGKTVVSTRPPRPAIASDPTYCQSDSQIRTRSGWVTERTVMLHGPCSEISHMFPPEQVWLHFPSDGPGRKVGEYSRIPSGPPEYVVVDFWREAANVAKYAMDVRSNSYSFRIQRLDAKMDNLGKEVVLELEYGTNAQRHLAAIEAGYFVFISDKVALEQNAKDRVRAIRLKCI